MSLTLNLFRLQQADSQLDIIRQRLGAIQNILEDSAPLRQARDFVSRVETEKRKTDQELRQVEDEAERLRLKIEQTEARLYGGTVSNPKELQDLQNEVASLKRYLANLEDRQLEAMLASEANELAFHQALQSLEQIQKSLAEQHASLTIEQEAHQKEVERLEAERQALIAALPDATVGLYNQLRQERRGVAVATVDDHTCSACGSTLTAALQQAARAIDQAVHCPTCGRILYAR
jgi:uncharacterized protein